MTDRRHSLKRGDRRDLCYGSKVTATFITIKQATKQLQTMSDKRPGLHPWWASFNKRAGASVLLGLKPRARSASGFRPSKIRPASLLNG